MDIEPRIPVGDIATRIPAAARVFEKYGIDYCCGGGTPLEDACTRRQVEVSAVLDEIQQVASSPAPSDVRWDQRPLTDLIDHILERYHDRLRELLPALDSMSEKVLARHGEGSHGDALRRIRETFLGLRAELESHMAKEEQILFPMIRAGQGAMAGGPISVMEHEHDNAGAALRVLRELTADYAVPEEACTTWRALWDGLAELERDLHEHIHLENNILFPRALSEAGGEPQS